MDVMVSNCNELERPTAPGVSPQRPTLLFILLKLRLYFVFVVHLFPFQAVKMYYLVVKM